MLALAAAPAMCIALGPGVFVPSLRHVPVTAWAVATLVDLAPSRVNVGPGTGFTERLAMGQRPNRWAYVASYAGDHSTLFQGGIGGGRS